MKKILSAGLILAQVFSNSCIVSANSNDNTKQQHLWIRASKDDSEVTINPNRKQKGSSSTAERAFNLFRLGLTFDVILQLLCAEYPSIALALSKYADDNSEGGFKFSEYVKPHASLNQFAYLFYVGLSARNVRTANRYFQIELICEKITGGWQQAAKIAALGFAKDIYVKHNGGTEFEFYYIPGDYGLTSVDACNYLQYLIQTADDASKNASSETNGSNYQQSLEYNAELVDQLQRRQALLQQFIECNAGLVNKLRDRQALLQSCISYKMWATANGAVTTAANKAASTIKNVFSSLTTSSTTYNDEPDNQSESSNNMYGDNESVSHQSGFDSIFSLLRCRPGSIFNSNE